MRYRGGSTGAANRTTWRAFVVILWLIGSRSTLTGTPQALPSDPLAALTARLTAALRTAQAEDLLAISAPTLPVADVRVFLRAATPYASRVVIRERARSVVDAGVGEWRQFSFEADRPLRYLAVAISNWEHVSVARAPVQALAPLTGVSAEALDPSPVVLVTTVATSRQVGRNRQTAALVARMVTFYANTLGEAPFPTLTVAAADDALPGGHAPGYLALVQQAPPGSVRWTSDPVAFDQFPDFFLAHEVAHQWWGQAVGWKTYHDQWISEGLAQYFAARFLEFDRGASAADSLFTDMRGPIEANRQKGPIALGYRIGQIDRDSRAYRSTLYNKTALVLDMLRRLVGDHAFFEGVRAFYREWRFRRAGTEDFQRALQEVTGVRLERFFAQWLHGTSTPRLRVTSQRAPDGRSAMVRVEQVGDVFDLPLDIAVDYADGRSERRTLLITEATSEHVITLSGPVRRIEPRDPRSLASW